MIPGVPLIELSIGRVTRDSTSSGASPGASVWISTWGGAKLGKTSKGIWVTTWIPQRVITIAATTTNQRWAIDHLTIVLSILAVFLGLPQV